MQLYLRLAWRTIWRHRRRTIIIMLAMGLSLSMMMWYDGLIVGFDQAIYGNAVKVLGGNIQVHAAGYREKAEQTPLLPLGDDQAIVATVKKTNRVLVAHEDTRTGGVAGEITARINELAFEWLDAPVRRVAAHDVPLHCIVTDARVLRV